MILHQKLDIPGATPEERREYVYRFNDLMIKIWMEQILKMKVYDNGTLYRSMELGGLSVDAKVLDVHMDWDFKDYGIYQDRGSGRETPRGTGFQGNVKKRERRPWMSKKLFRSYLNIRDFFAEALGAEFCSVIPSVLGSNKI